MGLKKYLNKAALRTGPSETEQIPRLLIFQGEKESESGLSVKKCTCVTKDAFATIEGTTWIDTSRCCPH